MSLCNKGKRKWPFGFLWGSGQGHALLYLFIGNLRKEVNSEGAQFAGDTMVFRVVRTRACRKDMIRLSE